MTTGCFTRRQVLAAGVAAGASAVLSGCGGQLAKKAANVRPAGSDLGAIEHVVFLMHENRSFDHYFGTYPGVRGFDDHPSGSLGAFAQSWPGGSSPTLLPFHLDTTAANGECTNDLSHEWDVQHKCWNGGQMDRFVATHVDPNVEGPANGVLTMGYYTRADLGFYYALADAFTICDGYHCSVMGPTQPNRLHALSGTIDAEGHAGGPIYSNSASQFDLAWTTMPERLQAAGISWRVYNPPGSKYQPTNPYASTVSDNVLLAFQRYANPSSALYRQAFLPLFPRDFSHDVATDTLPQVSWLTPPNGHDEHPPAPPAIGMMYSHQVLSILTSNPKVWAKTVLFVMHDENDGFFDHVPPPTPPPGTPGEYLAPSTRASAIGGIFGPVGLGFRVPLLVVSPFSRGGYVCSDVFDHTSQLRFLETLFDVRAPNISAWRRSVTGDLTSTLQVGSPDVSIPSLPATPGAGDPAVQRGCSPADLVGGSLNGPPYPVPANLQMPSQEPGTARRRAPATATSVP
ncbi:MAG TPA: alkaline phosphatase family protein [Acidimicrobiales bacterium]|nr:alkaline phosphatase family protein [Acidimicrobiales bacterium]